MREKGRFASRLFGADVDISAPSRQSSAERSNTQSDRNRETADFFTGGCFPDAQIRGHASGKSGLRSQTTSHKKSIAVRYEQWSFYGPTGLKDGQQHASRLQSVRSTVNGETNERGIIGEADIALPLSKSLHAALCMESRECQQILSYEVSQILNCRECFNQIFICVSVARIY